MNMLSSGTDKKAFNLIELLVTLGIVAVIASLLLASIASGRHRSKVTVCSNNFRQIALAAIMYSGDDKNNFFPSIELPTSSTILSNYDSIEPWFVALPMIATFDSYGAPPRTLFCPLRSRLSDADNFIRSPAHPHGVSSADDLIFYFKEQKTPFAFLDLFWWVPRSLEGLANMKYPDPTLLESRLPGSWPLSSHGANTPMKPIASDWLLGQWDNRSRQVGSMSGGHGWRNDVTSCNSAYGDGHVDTVPRAKLMWQYLNNKKDSAYLY